MITFGYGKPWVLNEDNGYIPRQNHVTPFSDPPTQAAVEERAEAVDIASGCTVCDINCVPMSK